MTPMTEGGLAVHESGGLAIRAACAQAAADVDDVSGWWRDCGAQVDADGRCDKARTRFYANAGAVAAQLDASRMRKYFDQPGDSSGGAYGLAIGIAGATSACRTRIDHKATPARAIEEADPMLYT